MTANLENQPVCVVTGGTSGIGNAVVRLFADNSYRIATCGRNPERLASLNDTIATADGHLIQSVDLSDMQQTQRFGQQTLEHFDRVDVLVNNAAVAPLGPLEDITQSTFEEMLNINIRSTFYLTQKFWPRMKRQGRGVVVNISSLAAVDPFPGFSIYGASKAWIDLMTVALSAEGKDSNVRVCSIRAGAVETPLLRGLFPDFPADQCVSPEQVAQSVFNCVQQPENFPSGQHFVVTNQT